MYTLLLGYFGEAMIAEKLFPPDSASFENVLRIRCNLCDTTHCYPPNTTPIPKCTKHFLGDGFRNPTETLVLHFFLLAQNTTKEWNPTPTEILHFTFSSFFNNDVGYHSIE